MANILLLSKPLSAPWNDSGKNLPRDLALHGKEHVYHVFTPKGAVPISSNTVSHAVSASGAVFAASMRQKAELAAHLLRGQEDLFHFFFAPNPSTSAASRALCTLRKRPTVQTVSSTPRPGSNTYPLIFADRVVVLSEETKQRLCYDGVEEEKIRLIPPGIQPLEMPSAARLSALRQQLSLPIAAPVLLFPGDYEFSQTAETFASAAQQLATRDPNVVFVFACRPKTSEAAQREAAIKDRLASIQDRIRFAGELRDMPAMLALASVVALPAESLYAKMDIPLVLLEAMSLGKPLIVTERTPLSVLTRGGGAIGVPQKSPDAIASVAFQLLASERFRNQIGDLARTDFLDQYTADIMATRYEALYREILS